MKAPSVLWVARREASKIGLPEQEFPVPLYESTRQSMFDRVLHKLSDPLVPVCDAGMAMQHTHFIDGLNGAWPIQTIPESALIQRRIERHANEIPSIPDLEQYLDQALRCGGLLREVGFPFAGLIEV